jgi:isoleucyl-tRNA synthetase
LNIAAVNLVIWTSTVWSLPANQAVAYGAEMDYCIVESESGHELVIIAQDLLFSLSEKLQLKAKPLATFKGCFFYTKF